jgi:hypothetical protein
MEMGLHAFDSLGSRRDFDAISATIAGTAYRAVGVATILLSIPHGAPLLVATSVIYSRLWHLGLQSLRRLTRQRDRVATSGRAGAQFWRLQGGDFHPSPARALFVVLPADSRLEVEAMVSNRDIGFIRAGQRGEIKVDTFNFIRYGLLAGLGDDRVAGRDCPRPVRRQDRERRRER